MLESSCHFWYLITQQRWHLILNCVNYCSIRHETQWFIHLKIKFQFSFCSMFTGDKCYLIPKNEIETNQQFMISICWNFVCSIWIVENHCERVEHIQSEFKLNKKLKKSENRLFHTFWELFKVLLLKVNFIYIGKK